MWLICSVYIPLKVYIYTHTLVPNFFTILTLFLCRKDRPTLTYSFLLQFFLLGLVGYDLFLKIKHWLWSWNFVNHKRLFFFPRITLNQGSYIFGLDNTSPIFASAVENAVPAVTFIMAVLLRQAITLTFVSLLSQLWLLLFDSWKFWNNSVFWCSGFQNRADTLDQERWNSQGSWNSYFCWRCFSHYLVQGANCLQAKFSFRSVTVTNVVVGRYQRKELDLRLHLSYWPLPVLVQLDRVAITCSEEIPSSALRRLI